MTPTHTKKESSHKNKNDVGPNMVEMTMQENCNDTDEMLENCNDTDEMNKNRKRGNYETSQNKNKNTLVRVW